jgi:hypothetical protein
MRLLRHGGLGKEELSNMADSKGNTCLVCGAVEEEVWRELCDSCRELEAQYKLLLKYAKPGRVKAWLETKL